MNNTPASAEQIPLDAAMCVMLDGKRCRSGNSLITVVPYALILARLLLRYNHESV